MDIGITKLGSKSESNYSFMVILDCRTVKDSIISRFNLGEASDMKDKTPEPSALRSRTT
jgi:hypothetical protein